jgi:cell division septum initiation protein DivIVA
VNKIEYGTEFLDQLKDSIHDLYDENKELKKEIERLNNIINELSEKNRNLIEDNMRLRKEFNLHSGKLYISDIEVKNIF